MKNIKTKFFTVLLAVILVITTVPCFAASTSKIDNKQSEIDQTEDELNTLQSQINKKQKELGYLSTVISEDEWLKLSLASDVDVTIAELEYIKESIENFDNEIQELEEKYADLEKQFLDRSRVMYQTSSSFSVLDILFTSSSLFDFIERIEIYNKILQEDESLFEEMKAAQEELENKKAIQQNYFKNSESLLAQLNSAISDLENHQEIIQGQYNELESLIEKMEDDEQGYYTELDSLTQELNKLEAEYAAALKAEEAEKAAEAAKKLEDAKKKADESSAITPTDANFCWPLESYYKMTSKFGYRTHPINKTWSLHTGIDLGAKQGTKVYAAQLGTVVFAGVNGGFGNCIIIDHGNGLRTLYGHLESIKVQKYDVVTRGQLIGTVGMSGSATGYHLHFEVQLNGTPVQPLNYVTLP